MTQKKYPQTQDLNCRAALLILREKTKKQKNLSGNLLNDLQFSQRVESWVTLSLVLWFK